MMKVFWAIGVAVCLSGGWVKAQWSTMDKPQPFVQPNDYCHPADQAAMQEAGIGILLRFGYLAENKDASALRGRKMMDAQGRVVLEELQDFEGNTDRVVQIEWYPQGLKMRKMTALRYQLDGKIAQTFTWEWDSDGRPTMYAWNTGSAEDGADLYAYNSEGKITAHSTLVGGDQPGPSEKYTYDKLGRLMTITQYGFGRQLQGDIQHIYQGNQLLIKQYNNASGQPTKTEEFAYDTKGRCIQAVWATAKPNGDKGIVLQRETWKYNERGDTLSHTLLIEGELAPERDEFKYDAKGRRTEYRAFDPDGKLFTHLAYAYDSLGKGAGWTKLGNGGREEAKSMIKYDALGRILAVERKSSESAQVETEVFTYDRSGKPLEHKIFRNGQEYAVYWFVVEEK